MSPMKWLKIATLVLVGIVFATFAFMGLLYATRGTPARTVHAFAEAAPPAAGDAAFLHSTELLTRTTLSRGHNVEILYNGVGTFPRLWRDLRNARRSIILQLYYSKPGALADSLKHILMDRAQSGVQVLMLLDAVGAADMSSAWVDSLRAAGVRYADFRPVRWYTLHKAQNRSHVRLVAIDGAVGYTGGFGIADMWQGNGRGDEAWRETNVRFTGPAIAQLQAAFATAWVEATGELLTGPQFFTATADTANGITAGLLFATAAPGSTTAERFLATSIAGARRRLYITNAYFVPNDDLSAMLRAAARRGVDVRVLTAGRKTDVKIVRRAAHARYTELLRDGVRIFEYQPAMIHAKTLVVDGVWSAIGTMNFDNRSIAFNDESNLLVHDAAFGAAMEQQFLRDLRDSNEFRLYDMERRPVLQKLLDGAAGRVAQLL